MKILSFGEVLWDVYTDKKFIGGAPLNFSAHLAKHGKEVAMLTSVGNDALSDETLKVIKDFSIDTRFITKIKELQTGKCQVTLDEKGIPTYDLLKNVAYDKIKTDFDVTDFGVLYFGTLALREKYNRKTLTDLINKNSFKEIFVDVNIRPPFYDDEVIDFACRNATIIKISSEELPIILKSIKLESKDLRENAREIADKFANLKLVIITCGSEGAIVFDCAEKEFYSQAAGKEKPVSTVGAGDSFSAGFLYKHMNDCEISECLSYATKLADFVVSRYDAVPDYDFFEAQG